MLFVSQGYFAFVGVPFLLLIFKIVVSLTVKENTKSSNYYQVDLFCLSESFVFLIMPLILDQSSSDIFDSCEKVPPPERY